MKAFKMMVSRRFSAGLSKIFYICPESRRIVRIQPNVHIAFYPLIALLALLWFLIRVIPKPSRVSYPCQQVALGLSSSLFTYAAGSAVVIKILSVFQSRSKQVRAALLICCALFGAGISAWCLQVVNENNVNVWLPTDGPNAPIGEAKGIFPGRVVQVEDASAVSWDGVTGSFWEDRYTDQAKVDKMHSTLIREVTGESTDSAAWDAVFRYFNREHGNGDVGYTDGEKIAIKLNMNTARAGVTSTNEINALPHVVLSLVDQLVQKAGVKPEDISVYDVSRNLTDNITSKVWAKYPAVRMVDKYGVGKRDQVQWVPRQIAYSSPNNNGTSLPRVVTEASYIINYAILKTHGTAGVTLTGKNHYGSIDRQEHDTINSRKNGMGTYSSIVDLMAHKDLGKKTLLFLIDALYAAPGSDAIPRKWNSLNYDWPASIFASLDEVAIDSVGVDYALMEFSGNSYIPNCDNYLHEAALIGNAPSGVTYDPEQDGSAVAGSLGVHEHWNNSIDRQYTRNLGTGDGIELDLVNLGPARPAGNILNGSFEQMSGNAVANWDLPTSQYSRTDEDPFDGDYCVKYEAVGQNSHLKQGALLRKNTDYRLVIHCKLAPGTKGRMTFDTNDVFDDTCQFVVSNPNGEWIEYSGEFNSGEIDTLLLRFFASGDFDGTAYIDQVQLINLSNQKQAGTIDGTADARCSSVPEV